MQCEAWNRITQVTIATCYRRASFVQCSDRNDGEENLQNETDVYVLPAVAADDFERYAAVDADISTEEIAESAIVSAQQPSNDQLSDSDDDDNVTTEPLSFAVAKQSLENIRKLLEQKGSTLYEAFYKLEAAVHELHHNNAEQRSVFDFFSHL